MFSDDWLKFFTTAGIWGSIIASFIAALCGVMSALASSETSDRDKARLIRIAGVEWQPLSPAAAAAFRQAVSFMPAPKRLVISYDNANCEALAKSLEDIFLDLHWPAESHQQALNPVGMSVGPSKEAGPLRAALSQALGGAPVAALREDEQDNNNEYREIAIGLNRPGK